MRRETGIAVDRITAQREPKRALARAQHQPVDVGLGHCEHRGARVVRVVVLLVLLAALESQSVEPIEAAVVDGASRWQIFRSITFPQLLPVTSTIVLIRVIEAFKIVDLPNVLTNGGPGTATESLTLHAYTIWRALDFGGSASVAYLLLFVVTFVGVSYVNFVRQRIAVVA